MINFSELGNYEIFEDLCEALLLKEGLDVRRLGRGPGQIGKDLIVHETILSSIDDPKISKWLIECKYTEGMGSISEKDIFNVYDRVVSQNANGYMLCTNARLSVNLEKTLNSLKSKTGIQVWSAQTLVEKVIINPEIHRRFFPLGHGKWLNENRFIYLGITSKIKNPLINIVSNLRLLAHAPSGIISPLKQNAILEDSIEKALLIIDEIDEDQKKISC